MIKQGLKLNLLRGPHEDL